MTEQDLASLSPIDLLQRLNQQVRSALEYYEHGMPMAKDTRIRKVLDGRWMIEIGDFVIMARFSGGQNEQRP
jgi:hypothetical protein